MGKAADIMVPRAMAQGAPTAGDDETREPFLGKGSEGVC